MKNIKVLGIDLAKNVFQLHGTDQRGQCVLRQKLSREKLLAFVANMPRCLIGIEACTGAHHWARQFEQAGHTVKIMAPQFVKPYVMSNKNDCNDARGIAEAVTRPDMKFVAIKKIEQQDILLLHRARALAVKQRTAQANQIRGLLAEYGIIIPKGITHLKKLKIILDDHQEQLTARSLAVFERLNDQFKAYEVEIAHYDQQIALTTREEPRCQELMKIEGIGPLSASAAVATIGDAKVFKNGRELAAWLGLVPKQHSSGNTQRLLGISKRGDRYLRTLLVHGARTVLKTCEHREDRRGLWVANKKKVLGYNKASVALANKNARTIWAILAKGESYQREGAPEHST